MASLSDPHVPGRTKAESHDEIMAGLGFTAVGLSKPSPAVDALNLNYRATVLQNYKMTIAGVTIADASMYLDHNRELQLVTKLNSRDE